MSDTGQPPKRAFEPPPWEREQFEELARRRAADEQAAAAASEAVPEPPETVAGGAPPELAQAVPVAQSENAEAGVEPEEKETPAVDSKRVDAMLIELSGQEPSSLAPIKSASVALAWAVGAVGLVICVIAAVILGRSAGSGPLSATIAAVGITIGGALVGAGVWLWARAKS